MAWMIFISHSFEWVQLLIQAMTMLFYQIYVIEIGPKENLLFYDAYLILLPRHKQSVISN